jgi:phytanoyl-CoA hydroxylase
MLNAEQLRQWHDQGFVVLPGFKPEPELAALRERALAIVDAFEPSAPPGEPAPPGQRNRPAPAVFSTKQRSRLAAAALLASATAVHCFFEEEAVDDDGRLLVPKRGAINKIGHALHDLDPVFERFSRDPRLAALVRALGIEQPLLWQSMLIFKQPRIGGEVVWHQDATFLATEPDSVVGLWFALEEATLDNGCLWVQPGGHRGPLRERYVRERAGEGKALRMQPLDATPWPAARGGLSLPMSSAASSAAAPVPLPLPLPVPAGTLVVLHGLLPHASAPNRSAVSRMAYTLHLTDGRARYSALNWLQRPAAMPVRGFD